MPTWEHKRLVEGMKALSPAEQQRLQSWAAAAEKRNPVLDPVFQDKFMASGGGASARYRRVLATNGDTVVYSESFCPFDERGKVRRIPLPKWSTWAAKATIEHRASLQTAVPRLPGYWLHWEVLSACVEIGIGGTEKQGIRLDDGPDRQICTIEVRGENIARESQVSPQGNGENDMPEITADDQLIWRIPTGTRLTCTKSVVMTEDQTEAFTAGQVYVVESMHPIAEPAYLRLTNNQGESHKIAGEHLHQFFNR